MMSLQETNPDQAAFFLGLFDKAVNAYAREDYVCVRELVSTNIKDVCDHMDSLNRNFLCQFLSESTEAPLLSAPPFPCCLPM